MESMQFHGMKNQILGHNPTLSEMENLLKA